MDSGNTKHDTASYENCSYKREILTDANVLYDGYVRAKMGSDWKFQVQKFEMNFLPEIASIQRDLQNRTYSLSPTVDFILCERGRNRLISGDVIRDRVVGHALCDEVLNPAIRPHLIYDNGASLPGKGITFTRNRLLTHLRRYYREHGNDGYILLIDFRKYYDNIRHNELMQFVSQYVSDSLALWLLQMTLDASKVDVSYLTPEEYEYCMNQLYDSLTPVDSSLQTGEKYMAKHMKIGNQESQTAGISYRTPIDNYVKIVKGVKYYGVYMDDSYAIHNSLDFLKELKNEITIEASKLGITVNQSKTRICKLSDYWRFLQIQYSLTDTGRVIQKINPKRLTDMRHKMKALASKMSKAEFYQYYQSWFRNYYKFMSKKQRSNMDELYNILKEVTT